MRLLTAGWLTPWTAAARPRLPSREMVSSSSSADNSGTLGDSTLRIYPTHKSPLCIHKFGWSTGTERETSKWWWASTGKAPDTCS